MRGFFEIGIYRAKTGTNIGTLWRSAWQLGATGIFTIGRRYKKQSSDTTKTWRHLPLRHFDTFEEFQEARPYSAELIGVELGGKALTSFTHPQQAVYLLGAEDGGLPKEITAKCNRLVEIESIRSPSMNVAVAGSIVMYHRMSGE